MLKKGFLFSLATILFLSILVVMSLTYLSRSKDFETDLNKLIAVNQIKFIEDSVSYEYYNKIIDLKPGIIRDSGVGQVRVTFADAGKLPSLENKSELARIYKENIEDEFSMLNNINITLKNFYPNFTILPYNSVFGKEGGNLTMYNFNYSALKKIEIELQVDRPLDNVDTITMPAGSVDSDPEIKVKIRDKGSSGQGKGANKGEMILDDEKHLNPLIKNSYKVTFETGGFIGIDFGNFNKNNGTYIVYVDDVNVNITSYQVRYDYVDQEVKAVGGNISINKLGIYKNTELILASR